MNTFNAGNNQQTHKNPSHLNKSPSLNWNFSQSNLEEDVRKFIKACSEQTKTIMQLGEWQATNFQPYRYYLIDHQHERLIVIFNYMTSKENWEFYDATYRVYDPVRQYEESLGFSLQVQEKILSLRQKMGQCRVYEEEYYNPKVFSNYFQNLLKVPHLTINARIEEDFIFLDFDLSDPAWLDVYSHYNPYVKEMTDFSLSIQIDPQNQHIYANEDYHVKRSGKEDLHTQYVRKFQITNQQLPSFVTIEAISDEQFEQYVSEIGLPLF